MRVLGVALLVLCFLHVCFGGLSVVLYPAEMVKTQQGLTVAWNQAVDKSFVLPGSWAPTHLASLKLDSSATVHVLARYGPEGKNGANRWSFDLSPVTLKNTDGEFMKMIAPDKNQKRVHQILGGRAIQNNERGQEILAFTPPPPVEGEKMYKLQSDGSTYLQTNFRDANIEHVGFGLKGGTNDQYVLAVIPEAYNEVGHRNLPTDTKIFTKRGGRYQSSTVQAAHMNTETIGGASAIPQNNFDALSHMEYEPPYVPPETPTSTTSPVSSSSSSASVSAGPDKKRARSNSAASTEPVKKKKKKDKKSKPTPVTKQNPPPGNRKGGGAGGKGKAVTRKF